MNTNKGGSMSKTIKERYDDSLLTTADKRRSMLNYRKLTFGNSLSKRMRHTLDLLYQAHQNYYLGFFYAQSVLCGIMLEQALVALLEEKLLKDGRLTIKYKKEIVEVKESSMISDFTLTTLMNAAWFFRLIPEENSNLARRLRRVRNLIIHDFLPEFVLEGSKYCATLPQAFADSVSEKDDVISIDEEEISERVLNAETQEIWGYYILTRTRKLLSVMYKRRAEENPPLPPDAEDISEDIKEEK